MVSLCVCVCAILETGKGEADEARGNRRMFCVIGTCMVSVETGCSVIGACMVSVETGKYSVW